MQEQAHQIRIYSFFQKIVYAVVVLEVLLVALYDSESTAFSGFLLSFSRMPLLFPPLHAKLFTLLLIFIVSLGTKAEKTVELHVWRSVVFPITLGLVLMGGSLYLLEHFSWRSPWELSLEFSLVEGLYGLFSLLGALFVQMGSDQISRYMKQSLGRDRWNIQEESFEQNRELHLSPTSINLPYHFRLEGKTQEGWININPFRGTLVLGTPGSGKSFGVIAPSIRQMLGKGYCMCLYDFKYPDLSQVAYGAFLQQKEKSEKYAHRFHMVNLDIVESSRRVNPFHERYIKNLAGAQEISEAMVFALQRGGGASGGSDQFFTQSAVNFLSACVYFFSRYQNGKYSTLPHILSFLSLSYEEIFSTLFSMEELGALLSPFHSAFKNRAFDQLEGQVGTLRVFLSRLSTLESYWVFSGEDVDLKLTDPRAPGILVLASSPESQEINSALYSAVLNRVLRLINEKGNLPGAVVADEFPTLYMHRIENVVATARSSKIAVLLGLQEMPQLRQLYRKEVADTIASLVGNILSGSVRDKQTLDWLERLFGKIKQKSLSVSISRQGTSHSQSERMEVLVPAGKIASLRAGEMVGLLARDSEGGSENYETGVFSGKIRVQTSMEQLHWEESLSLPDYYDFKGRDGACKKQQVLLENFRRIQGQVQEVVRSSATVVSL